MKENRYINIMSKVSERAHARLTKICKDYGFRSNYEILQYLITAFLRYADPGGEDTESTAEAEEIKRIFADLDNVERRVITARPTLEGKTLHQAICVYDIGKKKNALCRCIQYRPDGVSTTDRYDAPLKMVISSLYPRIASKMDAIVKSRHLCSYEDILIEAMTKMEKPDAIRNEINDLFSGYTEADALPEAGQQPKQHRDNAKKPSIS